MGARYIFSRQLYLLMHLHRLIMGVSLPAQFLSHVHSLSHIFTYQCLPPHTSPPPLTPLFLPLSPFSHPTPSHLSLPSSPPPSVTPLLPLSSSLSHPSPPPCHHSLPPSVTSPLPLSPLSSSLCHPSPPPSVTPLCLPLSPLSASLSHLSPSLSSSFPLLSPPTELYVLLLTDILVLMEKHEDKYVLRCHTLEKVNGVKEELSPVIRLKECLLRSAAADKGRKVCRLWYFLQTSGKLHHRVSHSLYRISKIDATLK